MTTMNMLCIPWEQWMYRLVHSPVSMILAGVQGHKKITSYCRIKFKVSSTLKKIFSRTTLFTTADVGGIRYWGIFYTDVRNSFYTMKFMFMYYRITSWTFISEAFKVYALVLVQNLPRAEVTFIWIRDCDIHTPLLTTENTSQLELNSVICAGGLSCWRYK